MTDGMLLTRLSLQFGGGDQPSSIEDLSAVAMDADGYVWLAPDELVDERNTLLRLSGTGTGGFGSEVRFPVSGFVDLNDAAGEADIEGMDVADGYLWFVGSHALRRLRPKERNPERDLERLARISTGTNRYVLGRIPLEDGRIKRTTIEGGRAGVLQPVGSDSPLITALQDDPHLGSFISSSLPGKENGFDVEGLCVRGQMIFVGLRGPVLRGWAILLAVEFREDSDGGFYLSRGLSGRSYTKYFLDLCGAGIRDLCWADDDLLILAGPTMVMEGNTRVFRLKGVGGERGRRPTDVLVPLGDGRLEMLFDLPDVPGFDAAEGMCLFRWEEQAGVLVVYDNPAPYRRLGEGRVMVDVFSLGLP